MVAAGSAQAGTLYFINTRVIDGDSRKCVPYAGNPMIDIADKFGVTNLAGGHDVMPDGSEFIWFLVRDGANRRYVAFANSIKTCLAKYDETELYYLSFALGRDGN